MKIEHSGKADGFIRDKTGRFRTSQAAAPPQHFVCGPRLRSIRSQGPSKAHVGNLAYGLRTRAAGCVAQSASSLGPAGTVAGCCWRISDLRMISRFGDAEQGNSADLSIDPANAMLPPPYACCKLSLTKSAT